MRYKIFSLLVFSFIIDSLAYAQLEDYGYKHQLSGVSDLWHKMTLPSEAFGKVKSNFNDVRVYGITAADTIEAPYILEALSEKISSNKIDFKKLNPSKTNNGYYITFEVSTQEAINQILLNFNRDNFDWRIKLEGSQDQQKWFTILEDYRILAIENRDTDYQFTDLNFPNSKYRYFRLFINSNKDPLLENAQINRREVVEGTYQDFPIQARKKEENKAAKKTLITLDFGNAVPLSQLEIDIKNEFDFYRKVNILYLADSTKTSGGMQYRFRTHHTSTLTSIDDNVFKFPSIITQKVQLVIENYDNQPLDVGTITARGYAYNLTARFAEKADYYLAYGNKKARRPNYDIDNFRDKIPSNLTTLALGELEKNESIIPAKVEPLFKNKFWLWAIMGVIILLLGGFSLKMMNSTKEEQ